MTEYEDSDIQGIEEMLGPPVDISGVTEQKTIQVINSLAFDLYKEAGIVTGLIGNIVETNQENASGIPRNQAICVGLIIRISKLMLGVIQLSAVRNRGEIVQTLNRCILEPAINLEFLVTVNQPEHYDRFVAYSFGPERELYDDIQKNIKAAGGISGTLALYSWNLDGVTGARSRS
jgi:hypothetical protein